MLYGKTQRAKSRLPYDTFCEVVPKLSPPPRLVLKDLILFFPSHTISPAFSIFIFVLPVKYVAHTVYIQMDLTLSGILLESYVLTVIVTVLECLVTF